MPPGHSIKKLKSLGIDLRAIRSELMGRPFLMGRNALGPLEDLYLLRDHRYRRVDDFTVLHVMDYEVLQRNRLFVDRSDFVCIQIMLAGKYVRSTSGQKCKVQSATTHVTNYPLSVSDTEPGQKLRGIWIACDRHHFVNRYGFQIELVPTEYVPIFRSALGMPNALRLLTLASNIVAVEQILACRLEEPLGSHYVSAKAIEIICNVVAQMHAMGAPIREHRLATVEAKMQAIDAAAEIYRRDLGKPQTVDKLAFRVGLNRNDLTAGFRERFGTTPNAYNIMLRMERAKAMLAGKDLSISDVARSVGYSSYASFTRAYHAYHGHSPSTSR